MPIYAYKCGSCGHAKDVLQKISDAPLSVCPSCGAESFAKQITAAGFQLKGSGWYVTDFRNGSKGAASKPAAPDEGKPAEAAKPGEAAKPAEGGKTETKTESSSTTPSKTDTPSASASGASSA
jgi:putative FmdB family regulatory protein